MPNIFEQLAAKTAGIVGAVKASFEGLDGVFVHLISEHREAAALIERIKTTEDPDKRDDLWLELSTALLAHERAELQVVYPALAAFPSLAPVTNEHERQADNLESLIADLDIMSMDAPEWSTSFRQLEDAVKRHVIQEETQFFPRALGVIGKEAAEKLEAPYRATKDSLTRVIRSV